MAVQVDFPERRIDVLVEADIVVCGGGPAGIAAAVAAGRLGAKVVLVEQAGYLGGLGTAGLVPCFCPFTDGEKPVARGVGEEVLGEMARRMGMPIEEWMPIHPETLKSVYDDVVSASGAVMRLYSKVVEVRGRDRIEAVIISTHKGLKAVKGRVFVDATGDGSVAAWAGAPFEVGGANGETQSSTLCFGFSGIDWAEYDAHRPPSGLRPDRIIWQEQFAKGMTPLMERHLTTGILRNGGDSAGLNVGHVYGVDGLDEESLTRGTVEGRRGVWQYLDWYRKNVPGCGAIDLAVTAATLGVRETRRITGEYVLSYADYLSRAGFDDEIGRCAYPIDVHSSTPEGMEETQKQFENTAYAPGESYGIPYRSLVPKGIENLIVAGRCISSDRAMQGSVRVMPYCFVTGQAAGVAASLASADCGGSARGVDIERLRGILREQGAFLP